MKKKKETEGLFALIYKKHKMYYVTHEKALFRMTTVPKEAAMFATKKAAWKYAMDHDLSTLVQVVSLV